MTIAVDLHLEVIGLVGVLAVVCLLIHLALRHGSALAWLTATMLCVCTETLVMRYAAHAMTGVALIAVLVPSAYLCASQAIRIGSGLGRTSRRVIVVFVALTVLSLALISTTVSPTVTYIPFQLAGIVVFCDAALALWKFRKRDAIDNGLLVLCVCVLGGLALRLPMFPALLGQPTPWAVMSGDGFDRLFIHAMSLLTSLLALLVSARIVTNVIGKYRLRAERDDLTDLLNRRVFDELVDAPAEAAGAVIMCDIDHFKAVNDCFGHHVGDEVIRSFACMLSHHGDYVARVGGEEFALLLIGTSLSDAVETAELICTSFAEFRHPSTGEDYRLSASFGVATFAAGGPIRSAMRGADAALYAAKRSGRNRVCPAPREPVLREAISRAA